MNRRTFWAPAAVIAPAVTNVAWPANVTRGASTAKKFGVHELVLSGGGEVANPFAIDATVTFTPESGVDEAVTVKAFYDGKNMWRARLYVSEIGRRSATSELPWAGQQPSKIEEQGVKTS